MDGVVTMRNSMRLMRRTRSRTASPMPGGMSITKKSRVPHWVTANSSIRAFETSAPRRGAGLSPTK